jgi:hypothetical protein
MHRPVFLVHYHRQQSVLCLHRGEKNRRPSTPRSFHLKNRENDLYFPVKLLHMKRRVFHWLLAAALAASLPLTAQSVAGRGMEGFAGGGSHFSSGARFGNRPGFARGPGFGRAFAFRQHDGRFRDHDRFFHRRSLSLVPISLRLLVAVLLTPPVAKSSEAT